MRFARSSVFRSAAIAAVALIALSGCSAEQTKAEACDTARSGLDTLQSDLATNLTDFQNDPAAAVDAIDELATAFSENAANITNTEVKDAADNTEEVLSRLADEFAVFVDDPESSANTDLAATATDLQTSFATLQAVCS
jgi:hypothetical protein